MQLDDFYDFDFYQLVTILNSTEYRTINKEKTDIIYLSDSQSSFSPSDITNIEVKKNIEITIAFLGLTGVNSPLPSYIIELLSKKENKLAKNFLDLFTHILTKILYRSWRKHRHYITYKSDLGDPISSCLLSLAGIANNNNKNFLHIEFSKLLGASSLFILGGKSKNSIEQILQIYFNLPSIKIVNFSKNTVYLSQNQYSYLNLNNATMGKNIILGKKTIDYNNQFLIEIKDITYVTFMSFLPQKNNITVLNELCKLVLDRPFKIKISLQCSEYNQVKLNGSQDIYLGFNSFLSRESLKNKVIFRV